MLKRQIGVERGAQGLDGADALLGLGSGRVLPEVDLGMQVAGDLSRAWRRDRADQPERHAPLLGAEAVLEDPARTPAGAQPQAETGNVVVEDDQLRLARAAK